MVSLIFVVFILFQQKDVILISGYWLSCQKEDMDVHAIHAYIKRSYWAKGIPLATMEKAINHSLCFGIFTENNEQVAFARIISDQATFAYMSDVYVLEEHRGKGLSKWMLKAITQHPDLQGLRRMMLATSDAHGLYQQFGFKALNVPANFMELHQPNLYQSV